MECETPLLMENSNTNFHLVFQMSPLIVRPAPNWNFLKRDPAVYYDFEKLRFYETPCKCVLY